MPDDADWEEPTLDEVIRRFRDHDAANFFSRFPDVRRNFFGDSRNRGEAAVLLPLLYDRDHWRILLTVRSENLRSHAGQIAFPGGKKDDEDPDLLTTALRETYEEIGLPSQQVQVISQMPPTISAGNHLVTPFVGLIPRDFEPTTDVNEVTATFTVPMRTFLAESEHHIAEWKKWGDMIFIRQTFDVARSVARKPIVGMTASVSIMAAAALYQKMPQFKMTKPIDISDLGKTIYVTYFQNLYLRDMKSPSTSGGNTGDIE